MEYRGDSSLWPDADIELGEEEWEEIENELAEEGLEYPEPDYSELEDLEDLEED